MDVKIKMKKAQITIFIILGIVVVIAIALFFIFRGEDLPKIIEQDEENPEAFLNSCLEPKVLEALQLISQNGGYISPLLKREFDGKNISYLCYTQNNYVPCIQQKPVLIGHLEKEIESYIALEVENCFQKLKTSLEEKGNQVGMGALDFNVELMPKKVVVNIQRSLSISRTGANKIYDSFQSFSNSRFYDLAVVVQEITSQEAEYCNFEHLGFMLLYPEYSIERFRTGNGDIIYKVEHKITEEFFEFAVRSCVIPGGF